MRSKKNGFSLIELVIALAILATVTTIAIRATSNLQNQAKYQSTVRSLNGIQPAIVGPANPSGSSASGGVTGFVADLGRLPEALCAAYDPGDAPGQTFNYVDPLQELLVYNSATMPVPQFYPSNVDSSVKIWVGWQGPYLQIGAGPSYIRDGWGHSLQCYDDHGNLINTQSNGGLSQNPPVPNTVLPTTPIAQIASWGADGEFDVNHAGSGSGGQPIQNNYNDNVSIPNPTITSTTTGFAYNATITGQVTMNAGTDSVNGNSQTDGGAGNSPNLTFTGTPVTPVGAAMQTNVPVSIWIAYFGPDLTLLPNNPVGTDPALVGYNTNTAVASTNPANAGAWNSPWTTGQFPTISGSNVTIGPRVLKAYVLPQSVQTAADFKAYMSPANPIIYAASTLNVTLVPGTQTINLVLPHYSP